MISKILFRLSKFPLFGNAVGFFFENLSFLIPVNKVCENDLVLAFYHPKPIQSKHIVIIPKKIIPTFLNFTNTNIQYLENVILIAKEVTEDLGLQNEYTLCINGGFRQEVRQAHFHLLNETLVKDNVLESSIIPFTYKNYKSFDKVCCLSNKNNTVINIIPKNNIHSLSELAKFNINVIQDSINLINELGLNIKVKNKGYTFLIQRSVSSQDKKLYFYVTTNMMIGGELT